MLKLIRKDRLKRVEVFKKSNERGGNFLGREYYVKIGKWVWLVYGVEKNNVKFFDWV